MEIEFDVPCAEYVTPEEHMKHAEYARFIASYHELKALAMRARLAGDIEMARGFEQATDALATEIERIEGRGS